MLMYQRFNVNGTICQIGRVGEYLEAGRATLHAAGMFEGLLIFSVSIYDRAEVKTARLWIGTPDDLAAAVLDGHLCFVAQLGVGQKLAA